MKITKKQLRQIIREEKAKFIHEAANSLNEDEELSTSAAAWYKDHESDIDAALDTIDHEQKDKVNILIGKLSAEFTPRE